MTTVAIPEWNTLGLLPPTDPADPTSAERSPYPVALLDVILRFAISPERCKVLKGFLDYRAALHGMGLVSGFQWLDGSFTEQVETLERRPPKDIDVVTFVHTVPRRFVWNLTARIHRSGARWGLWATRQSELSTNPPGGAFC